jgi:hypothetical protein
MATRESAMCGRIVDQAVPLYVDEPRRRCPEQTYGVVDEIVQRGD